MRAMLQDLEAWGDGGELPDAVAELAGQVERDGLDAIVGLTPMDFLAAELALNAARVQRGAEKRPEDKPDESDETQTEPPGRVAIHPSTGNALPANTYAEVEAVAVALREAGLCAANLYDEGDGGPQPTGEAVLASGTVIAEGAPCEG